MGRSPLNDVGKPSTARIDADGMWDFATVFGLLGPPSGTVVVFVALLAVTTAERGGYIRPADIGSGAALIFIAGFLVGLVPAALTGVVAYTMRGTKTFFAWAVNNAAAGAAICLGLAALWALLTGARFAPTPGAIALCAGLAVVGAAASVPPTLVLRRRWATMSRAISPTHS